MDRADWLVVLLASVLIAFFVGFGWGYSHAEGFSCSVGVEDDLNNMSYELFYDCDSNIPLNGVRGIRIDGGVVNGRN